VTALDVAEPVSTPRLSTALGADKYALNSSLQACLADLNGDDVDNNSCLVGTIAISTLYFVQGKKSSL